MNAKATNRISEERSVKAYWNVKSETESSYPDDLLNLYNFFNGSGSGFNQSGLFDWKVI